jgi:hypothetical protein
MTSLIKNRKLFKGASGLEIVSLTLSCLILKDTSLRELPYKIGPNVLMKFLKKKIETNLSAQEPKLLKKLTGGGLFGEFEWIPDSYDNCI